MTSENTSISTHDLHCQFGEVRAWMASLTEITNRYALRLPGSNGAGKTTTIRLLLGLLEASSGNAQEFWDLTRAPRQTRFA